MKRRATYLTWTLLISAALLPIVLLSIYTLGVASTAVKGGAHARIRSTAPFAAVITQSDLNESLRTLTLFATLPHTRSAMQTPAPNQAALQLRAPADTLPQSEQLLLGTLMEQIPDHIYFKDRESRFIRVNPAMARTFKLDGPDQAVGRSDRDFFTSEHAQLALADEQEILRSGKPMINREEKETWPDGSVTWVSTTKQCLHNKNNEIIGTFGISMRHQENEELS